MNNLSLLFCEDDKQTLEIYEEIFKNYFNNVDTSTNGKDALILFEKNRYDVVVLDINIPKIDGLEVAKKIREYGNDTKIIMLTAFSESDKLLKSIKINVDDYLIKPLKRKELEDTLNKISKNLDLLDVVLLESNIKWNKKTKKLIHKNKDISLTKNEILLLEILSSNTNETFSKDVILNHIYPKKSFEEITNNSLSKIISRLKKKIIEYTGENIELVQNCYSLGYKLNTKR